ncbi:YegP family protein [Nocardia goodfellowii]
MATQAGNGEVIAQSHAYASKDAASKGIASVQSNAAGAAVVDLTEAAK